MVDECFAVVCVNKSVKIISSEGASVTVIEAARDDPISTEVAVGIVTSNVVFGLPLHGFTVTGSSLGAGLSVGTGAFPALPDNIHIAGNIAVKNQVGFVIRSPGGRNLTLRANLAIGNETAGFVISAQEDTKVIRNVAESNGQEGFAVFGSGAGLRENWAVGNLIGFLIPPTSTLSHSAALGNRLFGVQIQRSAVRLGPLVVRESNIYGNGTVDGQNCGLENAGFEVLATNNFWGAATGPGQDPADQVCDFGGRKTVVAPFARREFNIRNKLVIR